MKILYVTSERRDAQLAANALRTLAQDCTLTWVGSHAQGLRWVQENTDVAVIMVDSEVWGQGCSGFVDQLRGIGLTTPVVLITPDTASAASPDLRVDDVVNSQTIQTELPKVVHRALQRTPGEDRGQQLAELGRRHALEAARRMALEEHLSMADTARQQAEQRHREELAAVEARVTDTETQHQAAMARVTKICTALQLQALELEAGLRQAEERHRAESAASIDRLARRHAEFTASLAQAARSRDLLSEQLKGARAALDEARQLRTADAAAAADRLARREAELGGELAKSHGARTALEAALAEARLAHQQSQQRAEADLSALAAQLADAHARYDAAVADAANDRAALEQQLKDANRALLSAEQIAAAQAAAAAEQLAQREAELAAELAESGAARTAVEHALADALAAHQQARAQAEAELAAIAAQLAELKAQYAAAVADAAEDRTAFEQQLRDANTALLSAEQIAAAQAAAAEQLAQREAELNATLADSEAERNALEAALAQAHDAHLKTRERSEAESAAAAARQAALEASLQRESEIRGSLEHEIDASRTASSRVRRRVLDLASSLRRRIRDRQARHELERADYESTLQTRIESIRALESERDALQQSVAALQDQSQRLSATLDEERQQHERHEAAQASERQRLAADLERERQSLDQVREAFDTLERISSEHAAERTRLEGVVADRDAQLSAQATRQLAAERQADEALARLQARLDLAREEDERKLETLREELEATKIHNQRLQEDADRIPSLLKQVEAIQKENRQLFGRAPHGLFRCTPDGVLIAANPSLVRLLGYRSEDELRRVDFATAVFESESELRWLIERAVSTPATDWVETAWRTKKRGRLVVRLQLHANPEGPVEILVEDVTRLRDVEEKLRQAQRMEAVGRLASEVAATCDNLLRDASVNGQQWLAEIGIDTPVRQHGELVLDDVTRAASYLRQLTVYGDKQVRALEPVSVHRVLRDLAPVLKRVVGEDIDLVLPKSSASGEVDVEVERVERVLVNVANYARERMPLGGRVKIDLATTVVDRSFTAKYPNVRPGPHVLITVTEVREASRPSLPGEPRADAAAADAGPKAAVRPGVDVGGLLGLIGECGGHLWIAAEPSGNMTLKIHLPKRPQDDLVEAGGQAPQAERGGKLGGWLRH